MQITSADTSDLEYFSDEAIDYRSGDKVRVTGGPFKGAEGYIKRIRATAAWSSLWKASSP